MRTLASVVLMLSLVSCGTTGGAILFSSAQTVLEPYGFYIEASFNGRGSVNSRYLLVDAEFRGIVAYYGIDPATGERSRLWHAELDKGPGVRVYKAIWKEGRPAVVKATEAEAQLSQWWLQSGGL